MFKPFDDALLSKLRSGSYWHADEIRWAVFVEIVGKVGHRWYMRVFQPCSVVNNLVVKLRAVEGIIV